MVPNSQYKEQFQDGALTLVGASRRSNLPYHVLIHAVRERHLAAEKRGFRVAIDPKKLAKYVAERH